MLCSSGEVEEFCQKIYQNSACCKRLGQFSSPERVLAAHRAMPPAERQKRLVWGQAMLKKVNWQLVWVLPCYLYFLLAPVLRRNVYHRRTSGGLGWTCNSSSLSMTTGRAATLDYALSSPRYRLTEAQHHQPNQAEHPPRPTSCCSTCPSGNLCGAALPAHNPLTLRCSQ